MSQARKEPLSRRKLGEQIRKARDEAGMTQQAAAEAVGVSQATWARIEAGKRVSRAKLASALSAVGLPFPDDAVLVSDAGPFAVCLNPFCPATELLWFYGRSQRVPVRQAPDQKACIYCGSTKIAKLCPGCGAALGARVAPHCGQCGQHFVSPRREKKDEPWEIQVTSTQQYAEIIERANTGPLAAD